MVSHQVTFMVAIALASAAVACLCRLWYLHLSSVYPALCYLLVSQIATTVASFAIGIRSDSYENAYLVLLILEWVVYSLMMTEIYGTIFSEYPGIAALGRWSVYGALLGTVVIAGVSIYSGLKTFADSKTSLPFVETAAHCFTAGFGLLIVIILVAISRYPLRLHKNVLVNAILFGAILLGEAAGLITDQFLMRRHTGLVNFALTLNTLLWFSVWPFLLSREDQTNVLRLRTGINILDESRLLGELNSISALIMRVARK